MQKEKENQKLTNIAQRALGNSWLLLQKAFAENNIDQIENLMWLFESTTGDARLDSMFVLEAATIESQKQLYCCQRGEAMITQFSNDQKNRVQICKLYRKLYFKIIAWMREHNYINFTDGYNPIDEDDFKQLDGEEEHGNSD